MNELEHRKRLKTLDNASVTKDKLADSQARLAAVSSQYAVGVGAPAWAIPLLA
jgi:hypothetical protein